MCIEDTSDPAYPVLVKLVQDFPHIDAQVLVESEDSAIRDAGQQVRELGPNPKIRNVSRAYREAKGDVIWMIDCNVWVASGVLGRMIDKLMGYSQNRSHPARPYKFVHQMPLVVDIVDYTAPSSAAAETLLSGSNLESDLGTGDAGSMLSRVSRNGGGRLDEMFMATTHVKFYGAINSVGIAPCIVGKSNMFRKSHLDLVTDPSHNDILSETDARPQGVDYFSYNICEDHLIGDLLWRSKIPGHDNHGIVWGDIVVQPMAGMSVASYVARRVRWLRARKFTVLAATLVEPGVESLLCCAYLSFAVTTLSWFHEALGLPQSWTAMGAVWLVAVTLWMCIDYATFRLLHSGASITVDDSTPFFARGTKRAGGMGKRRFLEWFLAWLGREVMALPIWTWAVLLGTTINWRGKNFYVRLDTTVYEVPGPASGSESTRTPELERARPNKHRVD